MCSFALLVLQQSSAYIGVRTICNVLCHEWCWTTPSWPAASIWPTTDSLDVPGILLTPRSMRNSSISSQSFPCFTYLDSQWMSSSPSQQELTASPCQNLKLHYSFQCECKESVRNSYSNSIDEDRLSFHFDFIEYVQCSLQCPGLALLVDFQVATYWDKNNFYSWF